MRDHIETLEIAKKQKETPDSETETIENEIMRIDDDICSFMDRIAGADDVVFNRE